MVPESPALLKGNASYEELLRENANFKQLLLDTYPIIATWEDDRDEYRYLYMHAVMMESLNWKLTLWKDWQSLITVAHPTDFVKDVVWKGRSLRETMLESLNKMQRLHLSAGGSL